MSSSNKSHGKERRRTAMACMNCRVRKLKCRPPEADNGSPCERCVKEGSDCEYRPVDSSSASNNHAHNYPDQDNPVNLYHIHPAPPPHQPFVPPVSQQYFQMSPVSGSYAPNQTQTLNPAPQIPFQSNQSYSTHPHQHMHYSSYPPTQHSYSNSGYPPGQPSYPTSSSFPDHSGQYMTYPHGSYDNDQRGYPYNGYGMDGSNSAKQ